MLGQFMAYALAVSVLFAIAALGTERAFALRRWPYRYIWLFALTTSIGFPISMALAPRSVEPSFVTKSHMEAFSLQTGWTSNVSSGPSAAAVLPGNHAPSPPDPAPGASDARHAPLSLDTVVGLGWTLLSASTLVFYALNWSRLWRNTCRLPQVEVEGTLVRITEATGPAVFGFFRPVILLPRWLLESSSDIRSGAISHERQHVAARDPLLLLWGLLLVALAPWNPALWWQLRRLRLGIEIDCDARVLDSGADPAAYAEVLLAVGQQQTTLSAALMALITPASSLERRVRIIMGEFGRLRGVAAASGVAVAMTLLVIAMFLRAPILAAPADLRKHPPQDTKPGAQWAQAVAHARFPDLFETRFSGSAELTMVFNRDGSLALARKNVSAPEARTRIAGQMAAAEKELGLDERDILYEDVDDIRTRNGSPDRMIGYIHYAVMKWPHDPTRAVARVKSAVAAYYPELSAAPRDGSSCVIRIVVLMNDDGTINRAQKQDCPASWTDDAQKHFAAIAARPEDLGRGGSCILDPSARQPVMIDYAWPRRAGDPTNVFALSFGLINSDIWQRHPSRPDTKDDAAIIRHYFPDIARYGRADVTRPSDRQRYQKVPPKQVPWILFGRDGRVWQTGESPVLPIQYLHSRDARFYQVEPALRQEVVARYPGILVQEYGGGCLPGAKAVSIRCLWISPDSPIQRQADVYARRRSDLLVRADYIGSSMPAAPNLPHQSDLPLAYSVNFGVPTEIGIAVEFLAQIGPQSGAYPTERLIATALGKDEVSIEVQTRKAPTASAVRSPSTPWTRATTLHIAYGGTGIAELIDTSMSPPQRFSLALRPELLRDQSHALPRGNIPLRE